MSQYKFRIVGKFLRDRFSMIYNAEENQKLSLKPLLKEKNKREYIYVFFVFDRNLQRADV